MAGGLYKAVVELPPRSGLPEDTVVNDFYFNQSDGSSSIEDDADEIATRLTGFYNNVPTGGTKRIGDYISDVIFRTNTARFSIYRKPFPVDWPSTWGSPVAVRTWQLDTGDVGTTLPSEVAAVLSFHGDLTDVPETAPNPSPPPVTIRPAARRRGRVYIGPLMAATGAEDAGTFELRPTQTFIDTLCLSALDLANLSPPSNLKWVVASQADEASYVVVGGYVDNAYDTQRRRGLDSTARTSWDIP